MRRKWIGRAVGAALLVVSLGAASQALDLQLKDQTGLAQDATSANAQQRVDVDPALVTDFRHPVEIRQNALVSSDLSDADFDAGPEWRAETFAFDGRAGEVVTAQVRSALPTLLVRLLPANTHTGRALIEGPAKDAPLRYTLKKDGRYFLVVHAQGPQHRGKYLLAFGAGDQSTAMLDAAGEASPKPAIARGATPAATVASPEKPATQVSFDWLDALVGREFIGTSPTGGTFKLTVSREGDALVMTSGYGRLAIRPGSMPGRFEMLEAWQGGSINDKASAYLVGSAGAPASDPLDGYYGDPRKPGDLVVSFDISGGYIIQTFHPTTAGGFSYSQEGGKRTFGVRRKVGDAGYDDLRWYQPATQQAIEQTRAYSASRQSQYEQQRREDEAYEAELAVERQQRAAAWEQTRAASEQALADSVARLNDTVASVEAQQAQQRVQDQGAQHAAQQRASEQSQGASLEVTNSDRADAPTATTAEAARKQVLGFCSGLTLGGFGRDNEAVIYVSEIGPVDYVFGQPMEPLKQAYAAKVGAAGLIPDCMVSTDRAVLERKRQEAIDNRGYPNAKRVMTGF